jgi:hypothetical protein
MARKKAQRLRKAAAAKHAVKPSDPLSPNDTKTDSSFVEIMSDEEKKATEVEDTQISEWWRDIEKYQKQMDGWRVHCEHNFGHMSMWIKAETARARGRILSSMTWYHRMIDAAHDGEWLFHEAVGCERCGLLSLERDQTQVAAFWLRRAYDTYKKWGAKRKLRLMRSQHSHFLGLDDLRHIPIGGIGGGSRSRSGSGGKSTPPKQANSPLTPIRERKHSEVSSSSSSHSSASQGSSNGLDGSGGQSAASPDSTASLSSSTSGAVDGSAVVAVMSSSLGSGGPSSSAAAIPTPSFGSTPQTSLPQRRLQRDGKSKRTGVVRTPMNASIVASPFIGAQSANTDMGATQEGGNGLASGGGGPAGSGAGKGPLRGLNAHMDNQQLFDAAQAISQEIQLDRALTSLMTILLTCSGADTGMLLSRRDDKWVVEAHASADGCQVLSSNADASVTGISSHHGGHAIDTPSSTPVLGASSLGSPIAVSSASSGVVAIGVGSPPAGSGSSVAASRVLRGRSQRAGDQGRKSARLASENNATQVPSASSIAPSTPLAPSSNRKSDQSSTPATPSQSIASSILPVPGITSAATSSTKFVYRPLTASSSTVGQSPLVGGRSSIPTSPYSMVPARTTTKAALHAATSGSSSLPPNSSPPLTKPLAPSSKLTSNDGLVGLSSISTTTGESKIPTSVELARASLIGAAMPSTPNSHHDNIPTASATVDGDDSPSAAISSTPNIITRQLSSDALPSTLSSVNETLVGLISPMTLPMKLFNYVLRTSKPLILHDASSDRQCANGIIIHFLL